MPDATVVVVDDAAEVRLLVRTWLRRAGGFDVVAEGATGAEAVECVRQHHPDLLVMDMSMPVMDGLTALPLVRQASPSTRTVMFTGFEERGLADRAREAGAAAYVEKSASADDLVRRLRGVLTGDDAEAAVRPAPPAAADGGSLAEDEVLHEHLERFREIFDVAAIGMATMTLSGTLVRVNAALASLLGQPAQSLVGRRYVDLVDDDHDGGAHGGAPGASSGAASGPAGGPASGVEAELAQIQAADVPLARVRNTVVVNGRRRHLVTTLAPVRDSAGHSLYVFVQVQDATTEREAIDRLRRSETRFRLLVETVKDYAIFMLSPDGTIESWNAGAARTKGYRAEEIVGRHFRIFYPPEVAAAGHPERELELALREGRYEEEGWRVRKDGSRFWANVVITAVVDEEGRHHGFAKVTRDTSERRDLELDRGRALDALAKANLELAVLNERLEAAAQRQADFLAATAHELRTPIGVVGGSADLLQRHWAELDVEDREDLLGSLQTSSARLRRLLEDLLTTSRLQDRSLPLDLEPVGLDAVVADAVATVRRTHPQADLAVGAASGLVVHGDRDRLAQVVENLLGNAVRHGGGRVRVTLTRTASAEGDRAEIRVRDDGPGVRADLVDRLFERFATGAGKAGTGLGLSIVRDLARAHHGDAFFEPDGPVTDASVPGDFVVCIPVAPDG